MSVIISSRCGIRCDECHYLTDGLCSGKCCEISKPFWGGHMSGKILLRGETSPALRTVPGVPL